MTVRTLFVVLFQGRSGSTYLMEALRSHNAIVARGEELVRLRQDGAMAQEAWAARYFTRDYPAHCTTVGFKTKLIDVVDPARFAVQLKALGVRIIHLDRANVVKQVISWMRGDLLNERTGHWSVHDGADVVPAVHLDPDDFLVRLQWIEEGRRDLYDFVRRLPLPLHLATYERLLTDANREFARILRFLNAAPRAVHPRCIKHTSDDLRRVVPNLDELHARAGSAYDDLFNEVLVPEFVS